MHLFQIAFVEAKVKMDMRWLPRSYLEAPLFVISLTTSSIDCFHSKICSFIRKVLVSCCERPGLGHYFSNTKNDDPRMFWNHTARVIQPSSLPHASPPKQKSESFYTVSVMKMKTLKIHSEAEEMTPKLKNLVNKCNEFISLDTDKVMCIWNPRVLKVRWEAETGKWPEVHRPASLVCVVTNKRPWL